MKILKYWAPAVLYMALIFVVSSMEQPPLPMPEFEWLTIDKLYHFVEYGILSVLLAIAFVNVPPKWLPTGWIWVVVAIISILYGASDEWHQMFVPGRFATLADWISDVLGAVVGVVGVYFYYRRKNKKRSY